MKKLGLDDILETERCVLKVAEGKHAEEMWNLVSDNITRFMPWDKCESVSSQKDFILRQRNETKSGKIFGSSLFLKSGEMVGIFSVPRIFENTQTIEIGYWLGEKYWGNGYIHEILEAFKSYVYEKIDAENIIIRANILNTASCKVAENASFHLDGVLRKNDFVKGKFEDIAYYSFTKEDYFKSK